MHKSSMNALKDWLERMGGALPTINDGSQTDTDPDVL